MSAHHGRYDSDHIHRIPSTRWRYVTLLQDKQACFQDSVMKLKLRRKDSCLVLSHSTCVHHFPIAFCLYLSKVPRAGTDLLLCAVVDPPSVIQHILLPLLLIIQEHSVLWKCTEHLVNIHAVFLFHLARKQFST